MQPFINVFSGFCNQMFPEVYLLKIFVVELMSVGTPNSKKKTLPSCHLLFHGSTRTMCEICSQVIRKAPEQRQFRYSVVFIVNFEQISHILMV